MQHEFERSVAPADDFFRYVNNPWIAANPIPPEESRWGAFNVLRVQVEHQLKAILEKLEAARDEELVPAAKKVRDLYRAGMDEARLAAEGDAPIRHLVDAVDAVQDMGGLSEVIGILHRAGVDAFWSLLVDQDLKESGTMALYMMQSGLGLPDRDYYMKEDEASAAIRAKYLAYSASMIASASTLRADGSGAMDTIIDMERRLAGASMTRVELRDLPAQYHKMSPAELAGLAPQVDWARYREAARIPEPEYMIVCQPKFMEEVNRILTEAPLADIKTYLKWHILNGTANFLGEAFDGKVFDFYGRTFAGATQMKPRWRRVLSVVNRALDEAVGELYVKEHFSEDAKAKINSLVDHLLAAYRARIEKLDWMGETTKEKALAKLAAVGRKLGYPEKWRDIGAMEIRADASYLENHLAAHAFEFDRQIAKVGKPVDRSEWYMSAQEVNACYNPTMHEMLFPAAILQPPFFDPAADLATNYGGIGTVIGHEVTHGFDDQGALFDAQGNMENWWTPQDKERFDAQTARLAAHYDAYEVLPGLHVNGQLTLGENIADLGGVVIAYDALQLALAEGADSTGGDLTPDQRFFANYAVTERNHVREEALRLQVQTDPHSPSPCRVNGPLSELPEFYGAFDVKEGNRLWRTPGDRVRIW